MSLKLTIHKRALSVSINVRGVRKYLPLGIRTNEHWSQGEVIPKKTHPNYRRILNYVSDLEDKLEAEAVFIQKNLYSCRQAKAHLAKVLLNKGTVSSFKEYATKYIKALEAQGQFKLAIIRTTATESILRYMKGNFEFNDLTAADLKGFVNHLKNQSGTERITFFNKKLQRTIAYERKLKPLKGSSIHNYLRSIKRIYNCAIDDGVADRRNYPFKGVMPEIDPTIKRNSTQEDVVKLEKYNGPYIKDAHYFLAQFYMHGIDFIDLAHLTIFQVSSNEIRTLRTKTNQPVVVTITSKLRALLDIYWPTKSSGRAYVFPILNGPIKSKEDYERYEQARKTYVNHLRKIAKDLKIELRLETKVPRHTWITVAKMMGVDREVRKQAVAHKERDVHSVYEGDFPQSVISEANALVIGEKQIKHGNKRVK